MNGEGESERPVDAGSITSLHGDGPRVVRLSRKAIAIAGAVGFALVGSGLLFALQPASKEDGEQLFNTGGVAVADGLAAAPKDYSQVPQLGPPLPGDLGKPILDAQDRGAIAALPPVGPQPLPPQSIRPGQGSHERLEQEREAARSSRLFAGGGSTSASASQAMPAAGQPIAAGEPLASPAQSPFLDRPAEHRPVSSHRLEAPPSSALLQAGSVIPAALMTGIRSDRPGLVAAQVTETVYDSLTGRRVLIPQGARLLGDYQADVGFGERRVLLAWNRLILPDGRSIVLERQPAADPSGYAGLEDGVDYHWNGVMKAALVSTLLGIGSELGVTGDGDLARAFRRGGEDSINRTGEQIVARELNVRPTLTIRPGYPVRALLTRDLVLDAGE